MTLIEIRKWQIEKAYEIDSKWAESTRQSCEKIFVTAVAAAAAIPTYAALFGVDSTIQFTWIVWLPVGLSLVLTAVAYVDAIDAQNEANLYFRKNLRKLGLDGGKVKLAATKPVSKRSAKAYLRAAVYLLGAALAVASGMALAAQLYGASPLDARAEVPHGLAKIHSNFTPGTASNSGPQP